MRNRVYYGDTAIFFYCLWYAWGLPMPSQIDSEILIIFRHALTSRCQRVPHSEHTRTAFPFTDDLPERDWVTHLLHILDVLNSSMQTTKRSPALSRLFNTLHRRPTTPLLTRLILAELFSNIPSPNTIRGTFFLSLKNGNDFHFRLVVFMNAVSNN